MAYNVQWDQLMLGVELGYNHMTSMQTATADMESRQMTSSDGFANSATVTGLSSVKLIHYTTLRRRAGHAYSRFLSHATLGAAVAASTTQ